MTMKGMYVGTSNLIVAAVEKVKVREASLVVGLGVSRGKVVWLVDAKWWWDIGGRGD